MVQTKSNLKQQAYYALEEVGNGCLAARIIGIGLFVLIVANAVMVFITTQMGIKSDTNIPINLFFAFSTLCFFIEYLFRIYVADLAYPNLSKTRARLKYMLSFFGIIDLFSFLPSVVTWFLPASKGLFDTIAILRLVRLIKLSRYMRGLQTIGRVIKKSRSEIVAAFVVLGLLIVASSLLMYELEHPVQPDKFNSVLTGIYWAVTTITTTGYGDIVPITEAGRMVGSCIMLLAMGIIAIPGGILAAGFVAEYQVIEHQRHERWSHSHPIGEGKNNSKEVSKPSGEDDSAIEGESFEKRDVFVRSKDLPEKETTE